MAKKQKPLLQEGTIRRMMKLANMDALGDGFITEKYSPLEEGHGTGTGRTVTGLEDEPEHGTGAKSPGYKPKAFGQKHSGVAEDLNEQEDELDVEAEEEVEDVGGDEVEDVDMEAELDVEEPAEEIEGEVTITDEEAQDIIDLADKLKDAVGVDDEAPEEEVGMEMDMEVGPEGEEMEIGAAEELPFQEGLYEAALQGLNIDLVDDKAERRKAVVQEVKKRIYERVVNRLIKESKTHTRRPKK